MNLKKIWTLLLACVLILPVFGGCQKENKITSLEQVDYTAYPTAIQETDILQQVDMEGLRAMSTALTTLRQECETAGLSCPYEDSAIATLELQIEYLQKDLDAESPHEKVAAARIRSLNTLYKETLDALLSYKYKFKEPMQVKMYDAATLKVEGNNFVATYEDGTTEPVYTVGYGHWIDKITPDIDKYDDLAYHIVQVEIGPNSVVVPRGQGQS